MRKRVWYAVALFGFLSCSGGLVSGGGPHTDTKVRFQTSERCLACHNGIVTPSGQDVSIGFDWRSSIMANSSRDPYWQGSMRRESIDHPESVAAIEDECSVCHMPIPRFEAKLKGQKGQVFSHLPFDADKKGNAEAEDGVTCSVCHQIAKEKLGTAESFNGGFVINPAPSKSEHPEYGPFAVEPGRQRIMHTSSGRFAYTRFRTGRHVPYAEDQGARAGRERDWLIAGTDAVPGVAAQRLSESKQLPVVPHAGDSGRGAYHGGAWNSTPGSASAHVCGRKLLHV